MIAIRATRSTTSVDPWTCSTSTATSNATTNAILMYIYLLKPGGRSMTVINLTPPRRRPAYDGGACPMV